jgi:type VI secretion system protein ImpM
MSAASVQVGFFGKIPCRGDFVQAGLSRRFIQAWDDWVQAVLPPCRRHFGEAWDAVWLAAPCWRFALPGGQCGAAPVLGLLLPSEDAAGRRFPLAIAAEGADDGPGFLDAAETVGRDAVRGALPPDRLFSRLAGTAPPPPATHAVSGARAGSGRKLGHWWTRQEGAVALEVMSLTSLPDADALAWMLSR